MPLNNRRTLMSSSRRIVLLAAPILVAACGGEGKPATDPSNPSARGEIPVDTAKSRALSVVPGGVAGEVRKEDEEKEHRWLVDVKLPSGSTVVVEVDRNGGGVSEIVGKTGPYEYDFGPPDVLRFAAAKSKALAAKAGDVKEWEVDLEKSEYEFLILAADGKLYEVTLDAKQGSVKEVEEKKPKK
jgi:uncharacterized membrane protein YkoI